MHVKTYEQRKMYLKIFLFFFFIVLTVASKKLLSTFNALSSDPAELSRINELLLTSDILVVGAGLTGTVMADLYARILKKQVLVLEKRDHIGGNCYDYIDRETKILCNKYGLHVFHTSSQKVKNYVHKFDDWISYEHRATSFVNKKIIPMPINIDSLQLLFPADVFPRIHFHEDMKRWISANGSTTNTAILNELNEKIYLPDAMKKWGRDVVNWSAEDIMNQVELRDNWDDRAFPSDSFQGLPKHGYTAWFKRVLANRPNINVVLNADFFELRKLGRIDEKMFQHVFYTGPIDHYFTDRLLPLLPYRGLSYEQKTFLSSDDNEIFFQPSVQVHYPQFIDGNFSSIIEYKHLYRQARHISHTTIFYERWHTQGASGYPIRNIKNIALFKQYQSLAQEKEATSHVHFVGGLTQYKYMSMDETILNALTLFETLEGRSEENTPLNVSTSPHHHELKIRKFDSIAFIVCVHDEHVEWVYNIAKDLKTRYQLSHLNLYIYNKVSLNRTINIKQEVKNITLRCLNELNFHVHSVIYSQKNMGREGAAWLNHFLYKMEELQAINIFVQANEAERFLKRTLFSYLDHHIKQHHESFKPFARDNINKDIMSYYNESNGKMNYSGTNFMAQFDGCDLQKFLYPDVNLRVDQIIRNIVQINETDYNLLSYAASYRGQFIVTDVLIRRMVVRSRDFLVEAYRDCFAGPIENPEIIYLLERVYLTLLIGRVVYTYKCCNPQLFLSCDHCCGW